MNVEEFKNIVSAINIGEANLVDVRRDDEWQAGHAKLAMHFDSQRIESGELPEIDKDKPVYLYCQSGGRAGRAKIILENKGFTKVYNLGGLIDWRTAGGEVI